MSDSVGPAATECCPTCSRPLPRPKGEKREKPRLRRSWTVNVPKDEQEDGADVLDTLLEECRKLFGHSSHANLKYHTVVQALALVVQHGHKLVASE